MLVVGLDLLLDFAGVQLGAENVDEAVLLDAECLDPLDRRVQELGTLVVNARVIVDDCERFLLLLWFVVCHIFLHDHRLSIENLLE